MDPEVSLDAAPNDPASATSASTPSAALAQRLAEHAPKQSRYKLEGEIARGGMGAILKIWDEDLRRHLAMKVILGRGEAPAHGGTPGVDAQQLARFLEEAQVTGQLDHPGIVPVHELGLDQDGRVYFTMKLVKGRDLKTIFELVLAGKEGWNETRALTVIQKVCEALAYAHAKGVIHRDLKPANVMVGHFGEVYVMDWGLARVLGKQDRHDLRIAPEFASALTSVKTQRREEREEQADSPLVTMDGDVVGTPAYMPLEQARGEVEKLSARSDVYSIGAMLYHLLARQAPYMAPGMRASNRTVHAMVLHGPPSALDSLRRDVPAELVSIVEKSMSRDASQRYPDTLALAEDLRAYLEHRVVSAYETGAWAETRKWVARNKPLAASLASGVVLLVVGLGTSLAFRAKADAEAKNARAASKLAETRAEEAHAQSQRADGEADKARLAAEESARQEALAKATLEDLLSLSAIQDLKELEARADALWPAEPDKVPEYDAWLSDARLLIEGQAADPAKSVGKRASLLNHEAKLSELRKRAKALTVEQMEADRKASPSYTEWEKARGDLKEATADAVQTLEARVSDLQVSVEERRTWEFEGGEDRWWHAQLSKLVADLRAFTDTESGGLYSSGTSEKHGWGIVRREEFARTIVERSVGCSEARRRWDEAIGAIGKSPKYDGLKMTPQLGLLPIGADPASGLWEFAHLQTGEPAVRGADGKLVVTEAMGLVLVLIPGGTFWMGAQDADASQPNFDPQARSDESPVHDVRLSAYFLSKYEMTQGQWLRMRGRNPSQYGPSSRFKGYRHDLTHPVEQVTWKSCMALMEQLGLQLPSEAQWEGGCRAGTDTPWWTGPDRESLRGSDNFADQTAKAGGATWTNINDWPDLEDGWVVHAPVGRLLANPYGLHDLHGNVAEWCTDGYDIYSGKVANDPVSPGIGTGLRVNRGGSFSGATSSARSADRNNYSPDLQYDDLGLRPARTLIPSTSALHLPGK
ncbi:MAG: SUMF1/EgtB/PvdO family nonheme iron enzyme [Planctomycetota bacterium]|nr:SUMF1/EgtB/PvdO family nonheme iron enzyme [Planctomycetota bacterium]